MSASFGIFSPKRDVKAAIAYDMQQEFRYRRAWYLNPNGGHTVDFGEPLPCGDDPCEFPKADCYDAEDEFHIKVYVDDTVYILGDIAHHMHVEDVNKIIEKLNGRKILIKDGMLSDIQGIHRMTIDRASEKKE